MKLKNSAAGYGLVTKTLHWLTFALLVAQFTVGYLLDDSGRGRGRGRSGESGRGRGGDDDFSFGFAANDDALLTIHVILGLSILAVTVARLIWRAKTPLPPWAPTLSSRDRKVAHWTERVLYACLIVIPLTGLSLILISDDLLWLHVTSHLVFFAAFAAHLGLVLKHQFIVRDSLASRML